MAGFRLSTIQGVERAREKQERARLAAIRDQKRKVEKSRETLNWDVSRSSMPTSATSAMMLASAAARTNRLNQSRQLDALMSEAELAENTAEESWSDQARRAAAIDKLHAKFLVAQRAKELKDERDQGQEAAQIQWLQKRKGQ